MSTWVGQLLGMTKLKTGSPDRNGWFSRASIWLDGEHARLFEPGGRQLAAVPLKSAGDVGSALAALDSLITKPARPGWHSLRVLLGAPFVRYFVLPWRPLPQPADWVSLARAQFVREGPGGADGWRFAVPDGRWGNGRLAVAAPEPLCVDIVRLCKSRKLRLAAIEPAFIHALSKHLRRIHDGAIAVVELEQVDAGFAIAHIGFREHRQWTGFITLPATGSVEDVMRDAMVLCTAAVPERTYVIAPPGLQTWAMQSPGAQWLPSPWDAAL